MKKIVVVTLLMSFISFAQEFQGKAVYQSHKKMNIKLGGSIKGNTALEKKLKERLKKMGQKTFTLYFTKTTSTYKENKQLQEINPRQTGSIITVYGGSGNDILYKNTQEKTYLNQKDLMGKGFLVNGKLAKSDWKLGSETKKIGKYTCYKATSTKEVEKKSVMVVDGDKKETKKKETIVTTAWYTPQIPISNGPGMYGGLPGLILEINEGKTTILCTELVLNPKKSVEIKKPTKGKKVSQKEFDQIQKEKMKEFTERFKTRKSKKNKNNSISIEIN